MGNLILKQQHDLIQDLSRHTFSGVVRFITEFPQIARSISFGSSVFFPKYLNMSVLPLKMSLKVLNLCFVSIHLPGMMSSKAPQGVYQLSPAAWSGPNEEKTKIHCLCKCQHRLDLYIYNLLKTGFGNSSKMKTMVGAKCVLCGKGMAVNQRPLQTATTVKKISPVLSGPVCEYIVAFVFYVRRLGKTKDRRDFISSRAAEVHRGERANAGHPGSDGSTSRAAAHPSLAQATTQCQVARWHGVRWHGATGTRQRTCTRKD